MNKLAKSINRNARIVKAGLIKHAPEIALAVGGILGVAAIVSACVDTKKLDEKMEPVNKELEDLHEEYETGKKEENQETFDIQSYRKNLVKVYVKKGVKYLVVYKRTIALGVAAGLCIGAAFKIVNGRLVESTATVAALTETIDKYRGRVREVVGEEAENDLYLGTKTVTTKETVKDEEGNKKTVKETKKVVDLDNLPATIVPFTKDYFTEATGNIEYDLTALSFAEDWLNNVCTAKGFISASEIKSYLGCRKIGPSDYVNGSIYEPDKKVSLISTTVYREVERAGVNSYEPVILLDFGAIVEKDALYKWGKERKAEGIA